MNDKSGKQNPPPAKPPAQDDAEELARVDDKIIGRAFRWSFVAVAIIAVIVCAAIFILKRKPPTPRPQLTQLSAPADRTNAVAETPDVKFTDITAAAGIKFAHSNGAYGDKLLPETMGGGVAFFDFDTDGDQDILFINSTDWAWHVPEPKKPVTAALYRNDGKGHFEDVTAGSGLDVGIYGMGVAVGDYDNDGKVDVFITAVGGNRLFRNNGNAKFEDMTVRAGVGGATNGWSTCAAWLDYDNDGKLDLFAGSYVKWSRDIDVEVGYKIDGKTRAYGQPMNFEGAFSHLYRNDGDGHFTDVSAQSGIQVKNPVTGVPAGKSLGVSPVDLDGDGWMDLVVANDTTPNHVFINQRNGTFREIGALSGVAFDSYGNTRGAMGIDTAHYRNDGKLGIAIGNFANEMTALYVAQNTSTNFTDEAITEGVGPASRLLLKFGVFFFDYDLDGWQDLLSVNGHLEEEISKIQKSQHYRQPAQLFWNALGKGKNGFVVVSPEKAGPNLFQPIVGRGSAFADIDGDGDLDVLLTQINGPPLLLRNEQKSNHHWIRLELVGTKSNRDAIGTRIKVRAGGQTQSRQVMPTRSYLSQSELPVTFGLGSATNIDEVEVVWPGGAGQKITGVQIDRSTRIEQPR
jgi:hypothetical protein